MLPGHQWISIFELIETKTYSTTADLFKFNKKDNDVIFVQFLCHFANFEHLQEKIEIFYLLFLFLGLNKNSSSGGRGCILFNTKLVKTSEKTQSRQTCTVNMPEGLQ